MGAGGTTYAGAGTLDIGGSNTFALSSTVAGSTQPYWSGYWKYTPASYGTLHIDTNGTVFTGSGDTMLFVYVGADPGVGYASDDDSGVGLLSSLDIDVTPGITYTIRVGTFDPSTGITLIDVAASFTPGLPPSVAKDHYFLIPGGTLAPVGGSTIATAAVIGANSISTREVVNADRWWKFTADTGTLPFLNISFDAMLSYDPSTKTNTTTDPGVTLYLYTPNVSSPTSLSDLTLVGTYNTGLDTTDPSFPVLVNRGQNARDVNNGDVLYIRMTVFMSTAVFLRVSDYGVHTDWIQAHDRTILTDFTEGFTTHDGLGYSATLGSVTTGTLPYTPTPVWAYDPGGTGSFGLKTITCGTHKSRYSGGYQLDHGFGSSEYPGMVLAATNCLWEHARKGAFGGGKYWTTDGSASGGSPGACVWTSSGDLAGVLLSDLGIGYVYTNNKADASPGGGHQTINATTYGVSVGINLTKIIQQFTGTTGYQNDSDLVSTPTGWLGGNAYYEAPNPSLVKLEVRPMILDQATIGADGEGGASWCLYCPVESSSYLTDSTTWGPKTPYYDSAHPTGSSWKGGHDATVGGPDDPQHYVTNAAHISTVSHDIFTGWDDLTDLVPTILANEAAWDPVAYPDYPGGMLWGGIPGDIIDDGKTFPLLASPSSDTITVNNLSTLNVMTMRLTLRPPRLRWVGFAVPPDVLQYDLGGWALEGYGSVAGWAVGSRKARWKRGERYGDLVSRSSRPEQAAC